MPRQRTFPNPNHFPAKLPQGSVHHAVTRFIPHEFVFPESAVGFGFGCVPGTAMPETAIYKHGQFIFLENEIRPAEDFLIPPPAGDFVPAK